MFYKQTVLDILIIILDMSADNPDSDYSLQPTFWETLITYFKNTSCSLIIQSQVPSRFI